jgi:hypothetical protein
MENSTITIIAIFLAAILMFVFPLMTLSDRTDDVSQLTVQTATSEFVDNIRKTGKLTAANYEKFVEQISATGNSFDVELKATILDENIGKKSEKVSQDKIGENQSYDEYTTQILSEIGDDGTKYFKEGDSISVTVKNTNTTISTQLKNFLYKVTGNDTYVIAAEASGMITTTPSQN